MSTHDCLYLLFLYVYDGVLSVYFVYKSLSSLCLIKNKEEWPDYGFFMALFITEAFTGGTEICLTSSVDPRIAVRHA